MTRVVGIIAAATGAAVCLLHSPGSRAGAQPELPGADIHIGELNQLVQFGRVGSVVGLFGDAPVCNAGTGDLDWLTPPNPNHPLMNFNLYRLKDDRLMQIGQSWVKHGLGASQEDSCNFGCNPYPNADRLGPGCSDTYSAAFNNASIGFVGPRSEVNPWTGVWTYEGSHLQQFGNNHPHGPIDHRLQVHDNDLDPALNPGAAYIYECYVLSYDDGDHSNSIAHEPAIVSGSPGGTWTFNVSAQATQIGPAIMSWPGANVVPVPANPTTDGQVHLAYKITQLNATTWHYEYAIYNHDMDRGIRAFNVQRHADSQISNQGFYAVASHEEPYSNAPWNPNVTATTVGWGTQTYAVNPFANVLRWGTMYNYWFDSNSPPGPTTATLTMFKPGTPTNFMVQVQGPTLPPPPPPSGADINGDGVVNVQDLLICINAWGACPQPCPPSCPADIAPQGGDCTVNVADMLEILNNWG